MAAAGLQETLPDGSQHLFPTAQHADDFWVLWRHLMPLAGSSISSSHELPGSVHLLKYPRIRLQRLWLKPKEVEKDQFADGSLTELAAAIQRALPKGGSKGHTVAASEFGVNVRVIIRSEPSSESRKERTSLGTSMKVYANPLVVWRSRVSLEAESCYWLPGVELKVPRPSSLLVKASNERGGISIVLLRGEEALQFARAWDAMNGLLSLDLLQPEMLRSLKEKLERMEADARVDHNMSRHMELRARGSQHVAAAQGPRMHRPSCFACYHEAGHTLLGILLPVAQVEGVFVERRGTSWAGGTEIVWPSVSMHPDDIVIQAAAVWLGGLAAEELMFGRADLGVDAGASFADDLVNVAALGTALVARRRDPALWLSDDHWDESVRQLAYAPPPTGWRNPVCPVEPTLGTSAAEKTEAEDLSMSKVGMASDKNLIQGGHSLRSSPVEGKLLAANGGGNGKLKADALDGGPRNPRPRKLGMARTIPGYEGLLQFVDTAYDLAMNLLAENVDVLHSIAGLLMERNGRVSERDLERLLAAARKAQVKSNL